MSALQFLIEAQKASKANEQIEAAGKRASQDTTSGMGWMRQSLRANVSDRQAVSSPLLKVRAAQAAFGTDVVVTDGNYNRWQQASRMAIFSLYRWCPWGELAYRPAGRVGGEVPGVHRVRGDDASTMLTMPESHHALCAGTDDPGRSVIVEGSALSREPLAG